MSDILSLILESLPDLLKGARFTLLLSLGGMTFGLLLGFLLALGRLYAARPIQWLVRFYVSFFRGTPLLVQLFVIYYGLPETGLQLSPLPAALIGFSLNMAAYTCEILRAAIATIDAGQWEAAASLGMSRIQTLRRIIIPQAARTFEVFAMYIAAALIYWAIASLLSVAQNRLEKRVNRGNDESGNR